MARSFSIVLSLTIALALGGGLLGCGGGDEPETVDIAAQEPAPVDPEVANYDRPSAEFKNILKSLGAAAAAERTYKAARQAKSLTPVERSAVSWLCETAWQLVVNDELRRIPDREYMANRLSVRVILEVSDGEYSEEGRAPYLAPVKVAVDTVDRIVDFSSFDAKQDRRYKRSCYGGPKT